MEFKKTNAKLNDFIEAADEQSPEKQKTKNDIIYVKIPRELKKRIDEFVANSILTLKDFIIQALLDNMEFFDDEDLLFIYQKAVFEKTTMRDYVRYKLGFLEFLEHNHNIKPKDYINIVIQQIKQGVRPEYEKRYKSLNIKNFQYALIKITACFELKDFLSLEEFTKLKKEAQKLGVSVKEYIHQKVRN